ncbi:20333_t:CDS:1 [Funneliformis geosporum]|uniref:1198_t:CDS:1 n=1 Tax=Funneliformis geosporum TaxID=1117311 RepID=A0A9W4WU83_9GLOM|nr:1198_t:CDS:1 [Funneliformis geosporum]CAI2164042.1 20333_t:CDS:1 [Funneliformis geosporum]
MNKLNSSLCNFNNNCDMKVEVAFESSREKFITYLPHSGLHNQRVALENAAFLAWALNRTLILPPLILGARFPFKSFDKLESMLNYVSTTKQENCISVKSQLNITKCETLRDSYTFYRWDQLFDLTFISRNVKIIHRDELISKNLFSNFNISNDEQQIWRTYGNALNNSFYDNRIFGNDASPKTVSNKFSIMELRERDEDLLYFNSLFGSNLIRLEISRNIQFMNEIRESFILSNPTLLGITKRISDELGGRLKYLSAHARIGDGSYKKFNRISIGYLINDIYEYLNEDSNLSNGAECKQNDPTKSSKIFYLASDATSKDIQNLEPIFRMLPCTFMLKDFKDLIIPMDELINERDGLRMTKFLLPILDLMIAANGNHVFTMKKLGQRSTFAIYLQRYHTYLQREFSDN